MITIDDPETERVARELAARDGETVEDFIRRAVRAQAAVETPVRSVQAEVPPEVRDRRLAALREFQKTIATLPILDPRSPDEILGYDEHGLPT